MGVSKSSSASGGTPAGGSFNWIWQPGGVAAGSIYSDLTLLVAAVAAQSGPRRIMVDPSFVATPQWTDGVWNFNPAGIYGDVELCGNTSIIGGNQAVQCTGVCTIQGLTRLRAIALENISSVATGLLVRPGSSQLNMYDGAQLNQNVTAGGPIVNHTVAGKLFVLQMFNGAQVSTLDTGTNAIVRVAGSGNVVIQIDPGSNFTANQLSAAAAVVRVRPGGIYGSQASATAVVPVSDWQTGTATLSSGTVTVTARMATNTRVLITPLAIANSAATWIMAPGTRTNGAAGSFVVNALQSADHTAVNTADTSSFVWEAVL